MIDIYSQAARAKEYYNGMQLTVKRLSNSIYGACGSEFFRFYNPEVAADITTEGKMFMFVVDHAINEYYHTWADKDPEIETLLRERFPDKDIRISNVKAPDICVYGDTDSRYVAMGRAEYKERVAAFGNNKAEIEYRYTNYPIEVAKKIGDQMYAELQKIQTELNRVNSTYTFEIPDDM